MNVLSAKIRWNLGWANDPSLRLLVDRVPRVSELEFEHAQVGRQEGHGLYWAERGGYVCFFNYVGPSTGFGGRTYTLNMRDGSEVKLKGPWCPGATYANKYMGGLHCVPASLTDDPRAGRRGYTYLAGYVTVELAREALAEHRPHAELAATSVPAGEGVSSDDQNLIISHGCSPYGGLSVGYVVRVADGRAKPSLAEVDEWGDVAGATSSFMELAEIGLDSREAQEEFRLWFKRYRTEYDQRRHEELMARLSEGVDPDDIPFISPRETPFEVIRAKGKEEYAKLKDERHPDRARSGSGQAGEAGKE